MKKKNIVSLLFIGLLSVTLVGCTKDDPESPFKIEGLTIDNYPKVDGSTSADPLNRLIACKLLGYNYKWQLSKLNALWYLDTTIPELFFQEHLQLSQTHGAFINLIDKKSDLILSARKMSPDEKDYAEEAGVQLIETPIALDAFVFMANNENPIKSLTSSQIQDIYTAKITNWKEVGGKDIEIMPLFRNRNSGSQELFETLVMQGLTMPDWGEYNEIGGMLPMFSEVRGNAGAALGFTVYYYKEQIVRDNSLVKTIAVNGVYPDKNTIKNMSYPYVAEVYVGIRSDLDKSSMAYKLYELLQTPAGKNIIAESGYIPN